jgi:hypothetical protein
MDDKEKSDLLKKIFTPILIILGTCGNLISIQIFSKEKMKKYSTFRFLILISFIDICSLYTGCGQIFLEVYFGFDLRSVNDTFCKLNSFVVYFFTHYSSMLMAVMSIDRTIVILSKNNQAVTSTQTTIKIFIFLGIILALVNSHFLFFTKLNEYDVPSKDVLTIPNSNESQIIKLCYGEMNSVYFYYISTIFPWVDLIFYVFVRLIFFNYL